jgi:NAD(P)-dependent dehydrogenase (short-subunit alcohol dehydrogenase family)
MKNGSRSGVDRADRLVALLGLQAGDHWVDALARPRTWSRRNSGEFGHARGYSQRARVGDFSRSDTGFGGHIAQTISKRRGLPEDLAGTFLFLASSEASFITGQVINVDGGWVMYSSPWGRQNDRRCRHKIRCSVGTG